MGGCRLTPQITGSNRPPASLRQRREFPIGPRAAKTRFGPVIYGANGMGGVIDFLPKSTHERAFNLAVELAGNDTQHVRAGYSGEFRSVDYFVSGDFDKANPDKAYFYYLRVHLQAVRQGEWKLHLPREKEPVGAAPFSATLTSPLRIESVLKSRSWSI